ncbi:hypothetical protein [Mucilaginibacter glaciei]|uniref:Lipocalin-like domain-containing protein n=1 Tax=Mucilaginibacter glaciei TaxID=2772109 RepID=A0A926S4H1_9SPHI|nr:hypothetical protein [Mucilaginibacter glaciei]MBD1395259.1 hypothetical protein [Mucilaginibacter glaciei]
MKSFKLFAAVLVATLLFSISSNAQTSAYYAGKWDVLVKGTPQGDVHLKFALADSASTIKGTYTDPESNKEMPLTKTELKDGKLTLNFTIQQYDLSLVLNKKDEDNVTGSLMGMFESTGVRVKP